MKRSDERLDNVDVGRKETKVNDWKSLKERFSFYVSSEMFNQNTLLKKLMAMDIAEGM